MTDPDGLIALRPILPIRLNANNRVLDAVGLIDSGADVNVLPHGAGLALGFAWESQKPLSRLSGNLGRYESRGVAITVQVASFAPVRLVFAWTQTQDAPLILGQVNFFTEFEVCFFQAKGTFEVRST